MGTDGWAMKDKDVKKLLEVLGEISGSLREIANSMAVSAGTDFGPPPTCVCGKKMKVKSNRTNGTLFWGCSTYPECTNTETIPGQGGPTKRIKGNGPKKTSDADDDDMPF